MRYFFNPETLCFDRKEDSVFIPECFEEVIVEEGRPGGPSYEGETEPDSGWPDIPPVYERVKREAYTKVFTDAEFFSRYSELESATELTEQEFYSFIDSFNSGAPKDLAADENGKPTFVLRQVFVETEDSIKAKRLAAYIRESDPLKNEAEYDAIVNGAQPDYTLWLAKVAEIKARYPLP